jgi:ABC-type multidrug transport system fused ATPase/permease subunit
MSEQIPRLFKGPLRENLTYLNPTATNDEIEEAASLVGLDKIVDKLPKGYESILKEEGVSLSSGQRQRISLARTLLNRPRIMILDEALSSIDAESESLILQRMKALSSKPTIVVITHNRAALGMFDRVFEVRDGQVREIESRADIAAFKGTEAYISSGSEAEADGD